MTATREQIIAGAREWIGTPWHHQARKKGVGSDCIGLFVGVLRELGQPVKDVTWYRRAPEGDALLAELEARFWYDVEPGAGSLLVFFIQRRQVAQHVGLLTADGTIIHANAAARRVCEQAYDAEWQRRTLCAYDLTRPKGGPA